MRSSFCTRSCFCRLFFSLARSNPHAVFSEETSTTEPPGRSQASSATHPTPKPPPHRKRTVKNTRQNVTWKARRHCWKVETRMQLNLWTGPMMIMLFHIAGLSLPCLSSASARVSAACVYRHMALSRSGLYHSFPHFLYRI